MRIFPVVVRLDDVAVTKVRAAKHRAEIEIEFSRIVAFSDYALSFAVIGRRALATVLLQKPNVCET